MVVVGILIIYWRIILITALVVASIAAVFFGFILYYQHKYDQQLGLMVKQSERKFRHCPCMVQQRFGVIDSIDVKRIKSKDPRVNVICRMVGADNKNRHAHVISTDLDPPKRTQLRAAGGGTAWLGGAAWLRAGGITLLDDLSVEAKAVRAAMECLKEMQWTTDALAKLAAAMAQMVVTLEKAQGNELLESSIPTLQRALAAFEAEEQKLQAAHRSAAEMLRKLRDFISVPANIRPILSFDLDQVFDPQRFLALEQSFSEVVLLNDAFRQLCKDALA